MAKKNTSPLAMGRMQKGSAVSKKKKKDEEEKKAVAQRKPQSSSVSKLTQQQRQNQKSYGTTQPKVTQKQPTPRARTATQQRSVDPKEARRQESARTMRSAARSFASEDRRTAAQAQKMNMPTAEEQRKARQATKAAGKAIGNSVRESMTEESRARMQRQKSGIQTEEDRRYNEQRNQKRIEVAKNTGAAAKKAVMDTVSGYGQTLADVDEMAKSNRNWTTAKAQKMGIDLNDRARVSKVEQERQQSIREAREFRQELFDKQEQRQAEWDKRTKNAKGLEKAWYGAVESGTGMLADTLVGAATGTGQFGALASMGLRTYGSSANQARKEGATDKEARLYGLAQSGKEMATELMFQGAGLAKAAYGKTGLSLADKSANILTKGLTGIKADAVGAGVRALGGTAEENVEELAGWMADPLIKELTYGKAVRNRMKENLRANIPQIGSDADAANVASYFSTPQFTDELTKEYTKSGMSKDKASELAAEMRDYYVAYYSGDQGKLEALEEDLAAKLSGQDKLSLKSWSMDELKDTFASTTLLTLATGMPGAVTTSVKGNQIFDSDEVKAVFGNDAVRKVADAVKNTSNKEMSLKAETMKDRLDSGKDLTGTQKYDLYQGYLEKVNETAKKARASYGVVENAREEQDLVPTMGRDRTGNTVYAKETQREYNEKFASTELTVEAIKNYMESDNSISDDEARRSNAVKKAVSDLHVGGLTVGDAHEFAYGNELAREALKAEEGIDLDQYVVRRSDGTVDLAATNEATENALFQINADNAIRAAQAETEVFIDDTRGNIDKDLLTRFGNNGQAIWKEVNKDLDPRDLKNYLTTANAASYFYSAGRNTDMGVDAAINNYADLFKTVDNSVLKRAYAAGARDRIIANTPGYGQTVTSGSNIQLKKTKPIITGQLIMDKDVVIPDSDQSAYLALAMSTNTNIHIVSSLKSKQGVEINGMSHGNDIYLNMNAAAESNLGYVFMHEMTHQIKQYAPNEYLALENLVRDRWFNKDASGMQKAIKDRIDLYATKGGQQLTEEEAVEEIIADAMAEAMDDPDFAAQVCKEDINLGQAILNSIREALRSIRNMFASTEFKNDRFHNSLLSYLGILDEAEKMWLNALHTARQNKADGLIADWQDRANKQNSPRLSVPSDTDYMKAVEALPSEEEDYFGRMKGLREIQKMVDEKAIENGYNIKAYHGTDSEPFNVFDRDKLRHGRQYGDGFYFSPYEEYADTYGNETREYYLKANGMTLDELFDRPAAQEHRDFDNKEDALKFSREKRKQFEKNGQGIERFRPESRRVNGKYRVTYTTIGSFQNNVILVATEPEYIKSADPITYDDNGNVIPLSQRFDESSKDTRFSISEPVERVADLIAVHNLNEEDLVGNLGLGGFPMPSIAITKDSMGHDKYGDISLLFNSSTIDPSAKSANQVFGGDAYTPTFPRIHYKANSAVSKKLIDMYYKKSDELGYETMRPMYEYAVTIDDTLDRAGGEKAVIERAKKDIGLKRLFLRLNDKDVEDVTKTTTTSLSDAEVARNDFWINELGKEAIQEARPSDLRGRDAIIHFAEWRDERIEDLKKSYEKLCREVYGFDDDAIQTAMADEKAVKKEISSNIVAASNYLKNGRDTVKTEIDYDATWKLVDEAAKANDYDAWVDDLFKGIEEKSGIRNDKDLYTPAGNRRSWESLHEPVTLDNVVKQMKKELDSGGGTFLGNNPVGAAQKKYKSLDEIRDDEDRLQYLDDENYGKLREEATAKLSKVSHEIYENSPKRQNNYFAMFGAIDVGSDIAEALNKTRNKDKLKKILERDYSYNVSEQNMDDLMDALHDLANLPTGYFEAKPKRAVWFDEVKAAIVPKEFPDHLKAQLSNYGTSIYEYDPEVEGDRTQKINDAASENDLRFSISANLDEPYMAAVNNGNMDEAQRLVDEAARLAGMRVAHRYHGTMNANFTVFDKAYAKVGGNSGAGFYFSTEEDDSANHYADVEGADNYFKWSSLAEHINDQINEGTWEGPELETYEDVEEYAKEQLNKNPGTYDVYLNYKRPYVRNGRFSTDIFSHLDALFDDSAIDRNDYDSEDDYDDAWREEYYEQISEEIYRAVYAANQDLEDNYEVIYGPYVDEIAQAIAGKAFDYETLTWDDIYDTLYQLGETMVTNYNWSEDADATPEFTRAIVENFGYDAIEDKEVSSKFGQLSREMMTDTEHIIVFKPEQIKLSDPATYAEDGSVIPLSERFDPTNNDIRYSLPTQDSDGNILTDGQMEYFKNSQARDEQGRLVPVYHTTNYGGFTIFDPSYSDDKRSLFFASNFDVSQTYGRNADRKYRFEEYSFKSLNDFAKAYAENFSNNLNDPENGILEQVVNALRIHIEKNSMPAFDLGDTMFERVKNYMKIAEAGDVRADKYRIEMKGAYGGMVRASSYDELLGKLSRQMSNNQSKSGYYSCYLNLVNPLIVDAKGANWNRISYDPYGNETAGITVQDAIEQIESADIADYGIKNIDVEFEYNDDGFPIAVSYDIGLLGIPDEEHWEWTNYVESDSFEPNVEEYTDNGVLDNAELGIAMWIWVEDKLRNYVSDGMIDMMEQTNIDVNGELHYESFNKTGYDFIRGGNIVDVSEFTDNIDDASGKEYTVNTRDLAEIAENYGHDGVIIRNLMDIGGASSLKGGQALSDIFIAFSSEQVKDINNENPTENPDIRYSITPEDEAKSQIAYDDAMDNSYELLAYYEQQLNVVNPETYDVSKAFREEDVVRFLDALKAEDSVPSDDPKFEEDRVRMAKSKEEFFNSVNARWNDRWITEGEVLKISSVKRDITNLVKGAMSNSDTDAQYRNAIVRKTLVDARLAYQLMKQDRTELASYILYHSAQRMIEGLEFIQDDTAFEEYKGIRNFLRGYRINAPEEYWQNVEFQDFRKEFYGRLRIGKGTNNIEDVYKDCQDRWPHLFNEAEREKAGLGDSAEDLLQHIGVVVDSNVTPFYEAYSSEEAASLAYDIADQLYEIIANGDREVSLADSYKERFDEKTKAMKQRHAEAILRERKIREEGIKKERLKFREYKEAQKEKALHSKHFDSIKKKYDELTKRLLTNTKDKHIPEQYKKELAELLKAFDFQTVGSKKREERTGYKAKNTIKLEAMRTALERIEANSQLFHINDSVTDIMKDLLGLNEASMNKESIEGKTLDELSAAELKKIDNLLGALLHEFNNYEKVKVGVKKRQAADIGHSQNDISLEHADAIGEGKDYQTPFLQSIDRIINLDMMTPAYLFRKIDPNNEGLGLMWKEIRRSFDKYVENTNQLNEWIEEIVGKYHEKGILWNKYGAGELSDWRSAKFATTFNLTHGTIQLTTAQMMSVACLANRQQAYDHMVGAGVVVAPVSFQAKITSDIKKKINKSVSLKLTDADIKTIEAALTPEQRQVANKLQELMATKMAAWGNEASMNVLGIRLFEDPNYFPIRSDKAGLTKDLDPNQFEQAIRNFGFAKAVQPGARNAIMIDDIFDVVTEHCNNMNLYNSYTEAMNDFMKVYNYREVREEGEYTVEQALRHAFSDKTPMFIMQFMRDLNGNVSGRASGIESMYNALLANAKKASVFANFRVAAQQPTAISRAFYVIDEKYVKGIKVDKDAMTEMFEHCPIALWKSWGYYDINMGKSIEDVIMNNGRWIEDKATDLYGKLDNVTWTAIWQMVKAETKDLHPELTEGSDEYWEHCNERMSEIVDLTQVVDSPMHRSHAMRDKGFFKKMTTAFMAEPTLTFNMLRDGVTRTSEAYKRGKKKLASQILSRTIGVYLLQSVMVAGAQSLVDALRGKNPDKDDDDDRFLHLWWVNFVEDWKDEFNPLGKIYVVKDIKSMMDGWESRNLALQGVYYLSLGYRQLEGDPYARSSKGWYENMLYGLGYLTGIPIKTMMTGISNAFKLAHIDTPILNEYTDYLDSLAKDTNKDDSESKTSASVLAAIVFDESMDAIAKKMGYQKAGSSSDSIASEKTSKESKGKNKAEGVSQSSAISDTDMSKLSSKAAEKAEGLSGRMRDEMLWDVVSDGYTKYIAAGDFASINKLRTAFEENGGDTKWFDDKVTEACKKAYKKSIVNSEENSDLIERLNMQEDIRNYMLDHGVSETEISDICYHSNTSKDLKAALRLGNSEYIIDELVPLVQAGLSYDDFVRLYDNRNRGAKEYSGKYTDPKYTKTTGTFVWPTQGTITSHFGYRNAPTRGASSNHPAIDIGAPKGTPVVAADGGVVIYAGSNGGYGNSVGVRHANGMVTYYNHLSAWNVKVGDQVGQGQQIANVGSTGISTGPHLDFKILDADGNPVDPEQYLNKRS